MKKLLLFVFISVLLNSGCNSPQLRQEKGLQITDSYQRKITIAKVPERIISASPAITEILFALGQEKRLIARTDFCTFSSQVNTLPSIGGIIDPSIETIASLHPDVVIASTHFLKEMADKIQQLDIPVVVLTSQESFEGAYELIRKTAEIVNAKAEADSIIHKMTRDVQEIETKVKSTRARPRVYYVIGFGKTGDFTAGGNTFISHMIQLAGGVNIAQEIDGWVYSLEKLVQEDPDIILIRNGNKQLFMNSPSYKNLKAVKLNQVFEVDNQLYELSGPRLSLGLRNLFAILHPDGR